MYCKNFITTYKSTNDYDISFPLYQSQLLQAFDLLDFDENKITNESNKIEKELINNNEFILIKKNLLKKFENSFFNEENIMMLFFSYDYFDEFHKCYIKNDFSKFNI
uniref:Uncharacterized protein n=1 Tax=Nucleocytoviricota sp. TaxID=2809609 RepID=A0A9E8G6L8_9VIRU|nr:hypothetical protein [Nucleocytoviricota sp.]UZT29127.1 hypothetical protein [Nucleocytoviricota sp.]